MYYYWLLCTVVRSLTFHKVEDNSTKVHRRPTASGILNQKFVLKFVGRGAFTSLIHPGHQNSVPLHRDIVAVSFQVCASVSHLLTLTKSRTISVAVECIFVSDQVSSSPKMRRF